MTNPSLPENHTPLQRKPDVVAAELDGELVMMNAEAGGYYGISGVGSRAFELLAAPISIDGMVDIITQEYDVTPEACRQDMQAFVLELMKNGMIHHPASQ